jgi:FkbM family methyltransferase
MSDIPNETDASVVKLILAHQDSLGGLAHPGALTESPLRVLEYYLARYFPPDHPITSAQTGCGSSTLVFGAYSASHTVFAADDRGSDHSTRDLAERYAEQHPEALKSVEFVDGVGGQSLFSHLFSSIDVAFINGPHAYPGPELAYAAFVPHLVSGSMLALHAITIPSIAHLFEVLCVDDHFVLHNVVDTTAFFWRTEVPFVSSDEGRWWLQRHNVQNFPALRLGQYSVGFELPIRLSYDDFQTRLEGHFARGFMLNDAKPVTEGGFSRLEIPLAHDSTEPIRVELEVELAPRCVAQSIDVTLSSPGAEATQATLSRGQRLTLGITVESSGRTLVIDIVHEEAPNETGASSSSEITRQGMRIVSISLTSAEPDQRHDGSPSAVPTSRRHDGTIVTFDSLGTTFHFFVDDPGESIQAHHTRGALYETEELALLLELAPQHLRANPRVLDIGANLGNHAVFFANALHAESVRVFEPQPHLSELLRINRSLNNATAIDLTHLGVALGAGDGRGRVNIVQAFNPGGAMIEPDDAGSVVIARGDDLLDGVDVDLIKIDVEGMEIDVLVGLETLIARCRPMMWIEVWDHRRSAFDAVINELGYEVVAEYRRYDIAINLFLRPRINVN